MHQWVLFVCSLFLVPYFPVQSYCTKWTFYPDASTAFLMLLKHQSKDCLFHLTRSLIILTGSNFQAHFKSTYFNNLSMFRCYVCIFKKGNSKSTLVQQFLMLIRQGFHANYIRVSIVTVRVLARLAKTLLCLILQKTNLSSAYFHG